MVVNMEYLAFIHEFGKHQVSKVDSGSGEDQNREMIAQNHQL